MNDNIVGEKFGRLTVLNVFKNDKGRARCLCVCDCGTEKEVCKFHLMSGATTSCGCYQKQKAKECNTKHNGKGTSLYNRWKNIRQRCNNKTNPRYKDYGARGIKVCDAWYDFETFKKWSFENGYEENLQIDRIDNDGNYEPSNCRWVDGVTNVYNRRVTIRVEGMTLREISKKYNVDYFQLRSRYYRLEEQGIRQSIATLVGND